MRKQQVFDICMAILLVALLFMSLAWLAFAETERPCKYVSPYKNTLQHDMHRRIECEDK